MSSDVASPVYHLHCQCALHLYSTASQDMRLNATLTTKIPKGDHFIMRCNKSFSANSRLFIHFSHQIKWRSFFLLSWLTLMTIGIQILCLFCKVWLSDPSVRGLDRLCNREVTNRQGRVLTEWLFIHQRGQSNWTDGWETCPEKEALQVASWIPCNWCHKGGSDRKMAKCPKSKKKKKKATQFQLWKAD